jgi:hypothetical protein
MNFSINNYLLNSKINPNKNDINFEPIKQYGVPMGILYMPPPMPNYISVHSPSLKSGGFSFDSRSSNIPQFSKDKKEGGTNMNLPVNNNEFSIRGGNGVLEINGGNYQDINNTLFENMFDKVSKLKSNNKTQKKKNYFFQK